jgi:hypothetical protein
MPTKPLDFLHIADRYKNSSHEYERRTSIGRSYYAVYNFLSATLIAAGVTKLTQGPGDHTRIVSCLTQCSDGQAKLVGSLLKDLYEKRRYADYRMDMIIDSKYSALAHNRAETILTEFGKTDVAKVTTLINKLP